MVTDIRTPTFSSTHHCKKLMELLEEVQLPTAGLAERII